MPKMNLSNVSVDCVTIRASKKNSGGAICQIGLTATMTKTARKAMKIGVVSAEGAALASEVRWPPDGEKSGKLTARFDTTMLRLEAKQANTLGDPTEVECEISLAD